MDATGVKTMKCAVIDVTGRVLHTVYVSGDISSGYVTAAGTYLIGVVPDDISDYWDEDRFVSIGKAPSQWHYFDYVCKEWIDPRSLGEFKVQKWTEIKSKRDDFEFGGFDFEGNQYDSDQVSQGRIMGAAVAGVDQIWTLADNTTVELSASQLQQLYAALQAHIASVHERGRIARQLIFDAETKEQVEAVNF